MEYEDYEDLSEGLRNLPMTWYPALILTMVKAAYKKNVFQPNQASTLIRHAVEDKDK